MDKDYALMVYSPPKGEYFDYLKLKYKYIIFPLSFLQPFLFTTLLCEIHNLHFCLYMHIYLYAYEYRYLHMYLYT